MRGVFWVANIFSMALDGKWAGKLDHNGKTVSIIRIPGIYFYSLYHCLPS